MSGTVNLDTGVTYVDRYTFASESTRSTNTMNIVFTISNRSQSPEERLERRNIRREIIVYDQRYLLHVNTSSPNIGGNENTAERRSVR